MKNILRSLTLSTALTLPVACNTAKSPASESGALPTAMPPPRGESAQIEPARPPARADVPMRQMAKDKEDGLGKMRSAPSPQGAPAKGEAKKASRALEYTEADVASLGSSHSGVASFQGRPASIRSGTRVAEDARSTFAVDVDTAAYSIARRSLIGQALPNASLVRVEELINYFHYDYDPPVGEQHPFAIQADGARSPVDEETHLVRIGLQARVVKDADRLPANLVFLVDTSGSMMSPDKLPLVKESLKIAVAHLSAKDQVAITTYAGGVGVVLPPTRASEKARIEQAIDNLASGGGTAMSSGLTLAYQQAARMLRPGSIARIIVCSDGDANIGATSPEAMLKQVEGYVTEGVTLSTIGYGDGNYKDETMETLADRGNGNYFYVDSPRQAERVFGRDLTKMLQDVAQDVKVQVEFEPTAVERYRLVGYENRDIADSDFRNDRVDAGEIGAGHQVTALYEVRLAANRGDKLATIRVRAKEPRGTMAKETELVLPVSVVDRPWDRAPEDFRFAAAVMGGAELLRQSPHARGWTYARVLALLSDLRSNDPDRAEFIRLMRTAARLSGEATPVSMR